MDEELMHHGILGQKWGVRRTQAELGHAPSGSKGDGSKKVSDMSDEELRSRISRMNMERQYKDLVASQNPQKKSVVKKLLGEALENLGRKSLGAVVDNIVSGINKKEKFDISKYQTMDVNNMDADTIAMVSKWYTNAVNIKRQRTALSGGT